MEKLTQEEQLILAEFFSRTPIFDVWDAIKEAMMDNGVSDKMAEELSANIIRRVLPVARKFTLLLKKD